jgi:capsular exopolysaccharide synthesis family protein
MGEALVNALRRRWASVLTFGLLGAALAAGLAWFLMPARYTAQALVHIASHQPRGVFSTYESNDDFLAYQRTQAAVLKGRIVTQAALRKPEAAELREVRDHSDPATWLAENLVVDSTLGPEILRVGLAGSYPDDLPIIVNSVVQAYLQEVANKEQTSQQLRLEQLRENHRAFEDELRRKRGTLLELEASLGVEDPQTLALRYQTALQQLSQTQKELFTTRLALQNARLELASAQEDVKNPSAATVSPLAIEDYLKLDPTAQRTLARLAQIDDELTHTQAVAAPGIRDELLEGLKIERAAAEKALADRRREVRPLAEGQLQARAAEEAKVRVAKAGSQVVLLQNQLKGLEGEIQHLEAEVKRVAKGFRQPDKPTSELAALRDDVHEAEQVLKKVADQLDVLKIEPSTPPRATLLEAADVPQVRTLDKTIKVSGIAGLAAFGLVIVGGSWREYRARKVYTEDDVVRGLGMSLVGTLPAVPLAARRSTGGAGLPPDAQWHARLMESVDAIRTQLLHAAQRDSLRVILVTSAVGGEGKTSLASHLASSLSRAGRKTLLIDGDLRNPGVHRPFEVPMEPGFSELLRGEADLEEVIHPTALNRLWVMPAGKCDGNAIQALAQERVGGFLDVLKARYDFVIMDSSPVLPVADALSLAQHANGVIFSVLREVSRIPSVYAAQRRLASLGIRILGTVVIGTIGDLNGFSYYYPPRVTAR